MSSPPATSYDELPYNDNVFGYAQPATLATVAALHGLEPPPLDRCRVLDLGCAAGANLLPMAVTWPGAECVGVDLSPRQVAAGRQTVARLGLANVTLHARNLMEPTDDLGEFDYIVCHGVYSWVPPPVQDRILDVIRRHLKPAGIAYASYNTYPGWHLRGIVRDALAFHVAGADGGPVEKTAAAREFLDFLTDAVSEHKSAYAIILKREAEQLRPTPDSYVYHEHLETDNRPVYFHQFAAHAAKNGLQYLAEATPIPLPGNIKPGVLDALAATAGDFIRLEQYLDFLRCRIFRRSVLCHANVRFERTGIAGRIPAFAVLTKAKPEAEAADPDPSKRETFVVSEALQFSTANPLLRAAMWRLWDAHPASVPFAELAAGTAAHELADAILQLYLGGVLELHRYPPVVADDAGPRPCATPFARLQAERGDGKIYTLYHVAVDPDPFARYLLPLLDGTRTRADLLDLLVSRAAADEFGVHDNAGQPVTDAAVVRPVLTEWLETALDRLAKRALLTA